MSEQEVIERAQSLGWKAESEWKGDPPEGGFRTATEFLEISDRNLGLSQADNAKLHTEIAQLHDKIDRQTESVGALKDMHEKRLASERTRGYNVAYAKYTDEQSEAIKSQDADAFAISRKKERDLEAQQRKEEAETAQTTAADTNDALITRFQSENAWFKTDFVLSDTAERASKFIMRTQPNLSTEAHLDAMKDAVQKAHPDHEAFRTDPAPVMDGGDNRAPGGVAKTLRWQDIPANVKAQFDRDVEDGLFNDNEAGRKEYMNMYSEA